MSRKSAAHADVENGEGAGVAEKQGTAEHQETAKTRNGRPKRQPPYNVILWDDDDHSYDYVIKMMRELFGHSQDRGYQLAVDVDNAGRTICLTTTMEHAELKRDQIHAYGRDGRIKKCAGSMSASIEPVA
jgi:ATP-dependent Clp protease adaptor protein ClpS